MKYGFHHAWFCGIPTHSLSSVCIFCAAFLNAMRAVNWQYYMSPSAKYVFTRPFYHEAGRFSFDKGGDLHTELRSTPKSDKGCGTTAEFISCHLPDCRRISDLFGQSLVKNSSMEFHKHVTCCGSSWHWATNRWTGRRRASCSLTEILVTLRWNNVCSFVRSFVPEMLSCS